MRSAFIIFWVVTFFLPGNTAIAQTEEDYEYSTEMVWGITKNTASGLIGGFTLKYSRIKSPRVYETFGLELVNVKHPKEVRYNSLITGNFFIWGKQSYLYSIRPQYGREIILFRKAPQQGVQISGGFAGGPSLGIIAPYYIQYATGNFSSVSEQYDPSKHDFVNILGTGRIFQGLTESNFAIGFNAKTSLSFEFGTFKSNVTGFEVGFLVDAYTRQVVLVPNAQNRSVFPTAFITLFYGSRR
jgi:hypothetical protein